MEVLSYLALAQTWNLLAGYTGLISVGQQAYVGLGGYLFFALAMFTGVPVLAALPIAGLMVGLLSIPTGWVAFRLKGAYFAVGTWVIAEVFRLWPLRSPRLAAAPVFPCQSRLPHQSPPAVKVAISGCIFSP